MCGAAKGRRSDLRTAGHFIPSYLNVGGQNFVMPELRGDVKTCSVANVAPGATEGGLGDLFKLLKFKVHLHRYSRMPLSCYPLGVKFI